MKITIKREQKRTRLGLPGVSNLRDTGAKTTKLLIAAAGALIRAVLALALRAASPSNSAILRNC